MVRTKCAPCSPTRSRPACLPARLSERHPPDSARRPERATEPRDSSTELDAEVRAAYDTYDYRKVVAVLAHFMNTELSAFYFDIRKDALYCDPYSSTKRRAALTVIDEIFKALVAWLAPILSFTAEEAWLARVPGREGSVHSKPSLRSTKRGATTSWQRNGSACATCAASLPARWNWSARPSASARASRPRPRSTSPTRSCCGRWRESSWRRFPSPARRAFAKSAPDGAFALPDVAGVGVIVKLAQGRKCARSWRILPDVGADPEYPDLSPRDAEAVREFDARAKGDA